MGCGGVNAGPDVTTICDVLKGSGVENGVTDEGGKVMSPEPTNNPSAGGSGSERTVRRVSTFGAVSPSVDTALTP